MGWWLILIILVIAIAIFFYTQRSRNAVKGGGDVKTQETIENLRDMFDSAVRIEGGSEGKNDQELISDWYTQFRKDQESLDDSVKNKTIIQLHHTDWCKFCQEIKKPWVKLRRSAPKNPRLENYVLLQVDNDKQRVPGVNIVPTLVKYRPDGTIDFYNGKKTFNDIFNWIVEN